MTTDTLRRPDYPSGASAVPQPLTPSLSDTAAPLSQFGIRMVQEAMAAAMPSTWLQKAATMEAARPKPGDFHGRATADELAERDALLALTAEQCRVHAAFLTGNPDVLAQVIAADVESLMLGAEAVNHRGN